MRKLILIHALLLVVTIKAHPQATKQQPLPDVAPPDCKPTKDVEIPDLPLTDVRRLPPGIDVDRELRGGSAHHYRLRLVAKHYVNIRVEKRGVTPIYTLKDPAGKILFNGAVEVRENGTDRISLIAENSGPFLLTIEPAFVYASRGSYRIRVDDSPNVTEPDAAASGASGNGRGGSTDKPNHYRES